MRLIDADKLRTKAIVVIESREPFVGLQELDEAPTVDAVEVVRCKDCKHAHLTISNEAKYCDMWSNGEELYLPPDFYCADGERRNDNA